jgi:hypothetical protein
MISGLRRGDGGQNLLGVLTGLPGLVGLHRGRDDLAGRDRVDGLGGLGGAGQDNGQ